MSWKKTGLAMGRRIADLCTGSGVVAITVFDICPRAVRCARINAVCAGVDVNVHLGSWARGRARAVRPRRLQSAVHAA
jgi:release factor glutamine methyltransferase